ncbi:MAG: SGNH/GDSL hydrolase family protein [Terracidiphilus sp.]
MSFPKWIWACTILACLTVTSSFARAATPAYDAIYVFGDSYCDVGNIYLATKGAEPLSPPYYMGRFSNGPIWVEHVASAMGLPMLPYLQGGTDFAFGGAWVTQPQVTAEGTIPDVPQQVGLYLSQHGGKADPNALYILEGGGNDIVGNLSSGISAQQLGFQIAAGISEGELLLRHGGARNFLIPDLLNVGLLPAAQANPSFATAASVATNKSLDGLLAVEDFLEGITIRRLKVFALVQAIQTDSTHFGFTNITTPCVNPVTLAVCSDPDHTFFWDTFHPTEFGHAFFAVSVVDALNQ